jgi:hypothetical protein
MKKFSLKLRLMIVFSVFFLIIGVLGVTVAWFETKENADEFFDSYQMALARNLASADWENVNSTIQKLTNKQLKHIKHADEDDEAEDEVLKAKILKIKTHIKELKAQLNDEEEKAEIMRKVEKAKKIFRTLDSAWKHMSAKEKQSVCQELIDRIEIYKDGVVDVHLKLRSYLIHR